MASVQVLSLGGSIIAPDKVDVACLRSFRRADDGRAADGRAADGRAADGREAGGREAGGREAEGAKAQADAQDWLGIAATRLNAELVRFLFQPLCPQPVVQDPTALTVFTGRVLVAGGWKPGFSTDYDAVLLARRFQADTLVNLSDVARIYSADPKLDPAARPLDRLSWAELTALVGTTWVPGKKAPFDPVATAEAARAGLRVVVAAGRNIENLKRILAGQDFEGTVVGPQ